MPVWNIIDRRKQPYRFKKVNAVIEPTRHDNTAKKADRAPSDRKQDTAWIGYDEREHATVREAITWADGHADAVTLYLYDEDAGIYASKHIRAALKSAEHGEKS